MSYFNSPNHLIIREQIKEVEKRYYELLDADAELQVLKPLQVKIKMLKLQLQQTEKELNGLGGFSIC
ncbi:MAG TPA: hypothetical protein VM888_14100 [Chitinophagaceae bacterium]|nr:hypothetical protein [Chitinophagaceae bacterium]